MGFKDYCFRKSLWVFHFGGASCNNCDIEILDCLTPRHDLERFGILLVGSIRHADVLLVNGSINMRDKDRLLEIYNQAPKPILVVAIGACGCTGGIFAEGITFAGPVDKIIRLMHISGFRRNRKLLLRESPGWQAEVGRKRGRWGEG